MAEKQNWVPLESNPDVLNKYISNLGVSTAKFVDVYGLDDALLGMVPRPVYAVMLLFPVTEKSKAQPIGTEKVGEKGVYFVKQTIGNACGTVAIVHALGNNEKEIPVEDGKPFANFMKNTKDKTPVERAAELESDKAMGAAHKDVAQEGQTQAPAADEKVNTHFIAFVCNNGQLLELNGSNDGPVEHSTANPTTADNLLENAAEVVKKFMERDPDELNFTLMALVKED